MLGVKIRKTAFWGRTKDEAATKVAAYFTGKREIQMVELNERAKDYMKKYEWKHIVLNIDIMTS